MSDIIKPGAKVRYTRRFIQSFILDPDAEPATDQWPYLTGTVLALSRFSSRSADLVATVEWEDNTVDRVGLGSLEHRR
jgi:hypothetical protein